MKKFFALDRYDLIVMLVSSPVIFLANYLILGSTYFERTDVFIPATLGMTALYVVSAWLMDAWMKYMRYRFGALDQALRRVVYCLIFYMTATLGVAFLVFAFYDWFNLPGYRYDPVIFRWTILIGWTSNLVSIGITESFYSYGQWKDSVRREYEIRQLHMQRQLDILKHQVNPHFLFNSLNSLLALIEDDPQQAGLFVEELSSVYRYVLRANRAEGPDQNLTDLDTELDFIHSYFHLLKTRHASGLELIVSVDEGARANLLPPLTLQLLVENAVKHNIVLPELPLTIEISTDGANQLFIKNTLQRKRTRVASNGVGLSNILTKYQLLGQPLPHFQECDGMFVVSLPLIPARS
ncbi:sensor histidine kinase [Salmonirosea aquatica]|uniref:Sensor protein lytS n=1 Tax=Salmonirosea aquatica TaxID=2654236 RepID=A0A7C9FTI4_9BACT|nr:sensor protein lytS [Cytophagaceae bacterium SJW1-29]